MVGGVVVLPGGLVAPLVHRGDHGPATHLAAVLIAAIVAFGYYFSTFLLLLFVGPGMQKVGVEEEHVPGIHLHVHVFKVAPR